jgi:hypothetical protein
MPGMDELQAESEAEGRPGRPSGRSDASRPVPHRGRSWNTTFDEAATTPLLSLHADRDSGSVLAESLAGGRGGYGACFGAAWGLCGEGWILDLNVR